jgi:hypothetical protein
MNAGRMPITPLIFRMRIFQLVLLIPQSNTEGSDGQNHIHRLPPQSLITPGQFGPRGVLSVDPAAAVQSKPTSSIPSHTPLPSATETRIVPWEEAGGDVVDGQRGWRSLLVGSAIDQQERILSPGSREMPTYPFSYGLDTGFQQDF